MHKRITFRGMDHSNILEDYVNQQLAKVEHFLENEREPIYLDIVLTAGKTRAHHAVEYRLKTPHYELVSTFYEGPKMYDVIDRVIDTLYRKLHEAKEKYIEDQRKKDAYKGA